VKGDNHDIGKNILASMLMTSGFNIIDLGTNVDEKKIVKAVKESGAKVIALSSLLSMTASEISIVDKALKTAGIRKKAKVIVGGAL
jgi:methylmalonyl-CoA mutase cobalamin-binding domain/chain